MNILKPITLPFEQRLHETFVKSLEKCNNTKSLEFIKENDVINNGILCRHCNIIKPLYSYSQNKKYQFGVYTAKCTRCDTISRCPYSRLLTSIKASSKRRGLPPPDFNEKDLKDLFKQQNSICPIQGEQMNEKYCDYDPLNFSIKRKNNSIHYTKDNIVMVCHKYNIDYPLEEIKSWFKYDSSNDGFKFDPAIFKKQKIVRRKHYKVATTNRITKKCSDCNEIKPFTMFYKHMTWCKSCNAIRKFEYYNNPYGFIMLISNRAKNRTRNDTDKVDYQLFVDILTEQGGRCAETGIPLVYKIKHKFSASAYRIDNDKGFVKGNIKFVIAPLNNK